MFLPVSVKEMQSRGWDRCDVIMVTGDAYVDHPSFGAAVISRYLESLGYKTGVISQPDLDDPAAISVLGKPRLFWGITSGNVDSMIANYTASGRYRTDDPYSGGNEAFRISAAGNRIRKRPDRSLNAYAQAVRHYDKEAVVVLGGVEASMRRLSHWDYIQNKIRHSVIIDTKADLLVYGMGERAAGEAARRLAAGEGLDGIKGTVTRMARELFDGSGADLPSHEDIVASREGLLTQNTLLNSAGWRDDKALYQNDGAWTVVQNPPAAPLSPQELDAIYTLPFERAVHPSHGSVPAFDMIKFSVTSHRGCSGGCAFCGIGLHQGKTVVSRSEESVLKEIGLIRKRNDFKGHITDIGGPSADMYGSHCAGDPARCVRRSCLYPSRCPNYRDDIRRYLRLLERASGMVKKVSIGSGLRLDLALDSEDALKKITERYLSGYLNAAPEHNDADVLRYMGKFSPGLFMRFIKRVKKNKDGRFRLRPYFIAGHPGETREANSRLVSFLRKNPMDTRAVQVFVPTPMTLSTAYYASGKDLDGAAVHIPSPGEAESFKRNILKAGLFTGHVGNKKKR